MPDVHGLAAVGLHGVARNHEGAFNTREVGGQVFGKAVAEVVLSRVPTQVAEGEHGNRQAGAVHRVPALERALDTEPEDPRKHHRQDANEDRTPPSTPGATRCNVRRGSWRTPIVERTRNTRTDRGMFFRRCAPRSSKARVIRVSTSSRTSAVTQNPARRSEFLHAGRDIQPIAVHPRAVVHDVAEVDANAKVHLARRWHFGIALGHGTLDGNGAFDRLHDAPELRENAVTGGVLDPPAVRFDHGQDDGLMSLEGRDGCGSSSAIRRLYPAISAARMAASRRSTCASSIRFLALR